ncbi:VOC family protein [Paenibacillus sp. FSL K6-1217]|uniref:VOC family protein n=1 Tax=Paenibacillus sp. FSL K6-1217 TaxID=2921466 RepID=UPI003253348B
MNSEFQIKGIGQISIRVHDMEAATRFYQDTLGLKLLFQIRNMTFLECNGLQIVLSIAEDAQFDHPSSVFYFQVDNIHASYETLIHRNVHFLDQPHKVAEMGQTATWMTFFQDPDQNVHALMSEVPVSQ